MGQQPLSFRDKIITNFLQLTSPARAGAVSVYGALTTALFIQLASVYQAGGSAAVSLAATNMGLSVLASLLANHVYDAQKPGRAKALSAAAEEALRRDAPLPREVAPLLPMLSAPDDTTALLARTDQSLRRDDALRLQIEQLLESLEIWQKEFQDALRQAYLNHLYEEAGEISLVEVDRQAAAEASTGAARAALADIYVPLLTAELEREESSDKGRAVADRAEMDDPRGESRRLSAIAQLDRHARLVLLGDPGSGKTTFAHFVAQCLAGADLGKEMNLATLAAPVPKEERETARRPETWSHGPLLPVLVELRKVAAVALPPVGEAAKATHLVSFLDTQLAASGLQEFTAPLRQLLRYPGGLVVLDGLDEVPEAEQRRQQILEMIEDFAALYPNCRLLVTSRTYSYLRQGWRLRGFHEAELRPFAPAQVDAFVDRWYQHTVAIGRRGKEDAQGRASQLKEAIQEAERLRELAARPLLLTLMAALHDSRGGDLPEKRWQLYEETVELLLIRWNRRLIERTPQGEEIVLLSDLAAWLKVDREKVRQLLNRLAFEAHASQPDLRGTADIAEDDLVTGLWDLTQRSPSFDIAQIVDFLKFRAGLLIAHGDRVYTFPHRTLQEHLAACHLTKVGFPHHLAKLVRADPDRWREVTLLAGARAAEGAPFALWALANALCPKDCPDQDQLPCDAWGALIAGLALVESGILSAEESEYEDTILRLQGHLVRLLQQGELPAIERASAGRLLTQLGDDPRPGVGTVRETGLPDILWCDVPAGPFTMGSKPEDEGSYDDERPQHQCEIAYDYRISQYPVTVGQYQAFVEAGGYAERRWWTSSGWQWRRGLDRSEPDAFGSPFSLLNHPVVNVSWYEALAFTRWLTVQLKDGDGWIVDLPSEAEWEKAARGSGEARPHPWEGALEPDRANYFETGLGTTSAVGCFPGGVSPYGVEECVGNVWEWTRSKWAGYPYRSGDGRESIEGGNARVVRGGSWHYVYPWRLRVSYRSRYVPHDRYHSLGFRCVLRPPGQ